MAVKLLKSKFKTVGLAKKEEIQVSLPSEKSQASDSLQDYITLLYGVKKIGKTSMCQFFEDALFFMCEPGAKALEVYQVQVNSWAEFKQYVRLFKADKRFRMGIVDPIDVLFKLCEQHVCQKLAISHLSEAEWGKGWGAVRDEFTKWVIGELLGSGKGVIFISHAKEAEIKTRVGDTYHKITSTMANQAREIIEGVVDIWCHYNYDGRERVLTIGGDDHVDAGHRISEHFRYRDGERIRNIPMGKDEKEAYDNFVAAFENKLEQSAPKEVKKPIKKLSFKKK